MTRAFPAAVIVATFWLLAGAAQQPQGPFEVQAQKLRAILEAYRTLASDPRMPVIDALGRTLHPGEEHSQVPPLRRLLGRLGDLPSSVAAPDQRPDDVYDPALVAAVTRFQNRHGLAADGVIGPETAAALRTPMRDRVVQIEQALARLERLEPTAASRLIVVNIPMFHLWAWDADDPAGTPILDSRVIVGTTATPTPEFDAVVTQVVFRPEWNVPQSIVRNEIVPDLVKDPAHLARVGYELLGPGGVRLPNGQVSPETIARLRSGELRLRQPPGPANPLGGIRLVSPNPFDVYLHDTSNRLRFEEPRRALSHGCVRVDEIAQLATWLLDDDQIWAAERVAEAMTGPGLRIVPLDRPASVRLVYLLALVWPDGTVHFARDLYRRMPEPAAPGGCPS